jgi:hypothetical protein
MKNTLKKQAATANVPRNKEEMTAMVRATVEAQLQLEQLTAQRDAAQLAAGQPFAGGISDLQNTMARNLELLETWSVQNPKEFGEAKSMVVESHRMGWKLGNWKTELKSKVTWAAVVQKIRGWINAARPGNLPPDKEERDEIKLRAAFAKVWLRVKFEVAPAKDGMIAAREDEKASGLLSELGVKVVQEEEFYLAPDREGQADALLTTSGQ